MLLTKKQEKSIVSYLKESFKLPEKGIVAGQAVASLVYKELGFDIPFFINDIDVFTTEGEAITTSHLKPKDMATFIVGELGSGLQLRYANKYLRQYQVLKSSISEDDLNVNIIQVSLRKTRNLESKDEDETEVLKTEEIINSFDLNCCCVGFDLEKEKIIYTPSFNDFCHSKQLRVNSSHTPYHTSLRLYKKINELENVFCNIKQELACLFYNEGRFSGQTMVGNKFKQDFENYATEDIKNLFNVFEYKGDDESTLDKQSLGLCYIEKDLDNMKMFFDENGFLNASYSSGISNSANTLVHQFHLINNTGLFSKAYKTKINNIENNSVLESTLLENDMLLSPLTPVELNYKRSKLNQISKMLSSHNLLIKSINDLNTSEMLSVLRDLYIHCECKQSKKFVIGALEMGLIDVATLKDVILLERDEIIKIIFKDIEYNKNKTKLKAINLPFIKLKPLEQIVDFADEGTKQSNCILGYYSNACKDEKSSFYSLSLFGSEVSIHIHDQELRQYYGSHNNIMYGFKHRLATILLEVLHGKKIKKAITKEFSSDLYRFKRKKNMLFKKYFKIEPKSNSTKTPFNKLDILVEFDDDIPF